MCDKRSSVRLTLPSEKTIRVDSCMREKILFMNRQGMETLACCCGHGIYPETIVVNSPFGRMIITEGILYNLMSRKKRFYVKDEKGYFYIPEAKEEIEKLTENIKEKCIIGHFGDQTHCGTEMWEGCVVQEECNEVCRKEHPELFTPICDLMESKKSENT